MSTCVAVSSAQDPQDAGPGYRNVVGLPGGVKSPLFKVLKVESSALAGERSSTAAMPHI